jgi:hypothetical protein
MGPFATRMSIEYLPSSLASVDKVPPQVLSVVLRRLSEFVFIMSRYFYPGDNSMALHLADDFWACGYDCLEVAAQNFVFEGFSTESEMMDVFLESSSCCG